LVLNKIQKEGGASMQTEAIVVAAGKGTRMGTKKQFLPLAGLPILVRTLQTLAACPSIDRILIVGAEEDLNRIHELVSEIPKISRIVPGGRERQDSVRCGLNALHPDTQYVAVHDAARPLVTVEEVEAVIETAKQHGAATLGVPVKDTIKRVERGQVRETLPREQLWAVHTPQAFRRELLEEAHRRVSGIGTDDASLVEWAGYPVQMVQGNYENIKITTPEDLWFAELIWKKKEVPSP
jgi:2-C-methyl-D-erythritol 4-phosphate cytidylyltransferase